MILFGLRYIMPKEETKETNERTESRTQTYVLDKTLSTEERIFYINPDDRLFVINDGDDVIHHTYFSSEYDESKEQCRWACYELTKSSIVAPNVKRWDWYISDGLVESGSAEYHDYSGSHYSRGHIVPAGDMAFNELAMKESFVMSNMSPQVRNFNGGVWNELEQCVRDWAYDYDKIAVCSGPVFFDDQIDFIGRNKVAVPHAFYKVILDLSTNNSIGFIIPNRVTDLPLAEFATTVDEVEKETGLDFFSKYYKSKKEESDTESNYAMDSWRINEGRYIKRINNWNKRK